MKSATIHRLARAKQCLRSQLAGAARPRRLRKWAGRREQRRNAAQWPQSPWLWWLSNQWSINNRTSPRAIHLLKESLMKLQWPQQQALSQTRNRQTERNKLGREKSLRAMKTQLLDWKGSVAVTVASARQKSSWLAYRMSFEAAICSGQDKRLLKFQKRQAWQRPKFTSGGGTRHASEWRNLGKSIMIFSCRLGITLKVSLAHQKARRKAEIRKTCQSKQIWRRLPNSGRISRLVRKKDMS